MFVNKTLTPYFLHRTCAPNPISAIRRCNAWRADGKTGSKIFSVPLVLANEKASEIDNELDTRRVSVEFSLHLGYLFHMTLQIQGEKGSVWQTQAMPDWLFARVVLSWVIPEFFLRTNCVNNIESRMISTRVLTFSPRASHRSH